MDDMWKAIPMDYSGFQLLGRLVPSIIALSLLGMFSLF